MQSSVMNTLICFDLHDLNIHLKKQEKQGERKPKEQRSLQLKCL